MSTRRRTAAVVTALLGTAFVSAPSTAAQNWTISAEPSASAQRDTSSLRDGRQLYVTEQEPRQLTTPTNRLSVDTSADTGEVDARVRRADGSWSEWSTARDGDISLPVAGDTVQTRIVQTVTTGARPAALEATVAERPATRVAPVRAPAAGLSYRVFATREGLVGGTTASGHVITDRDHFVALPSRRGLSGANDGNYSVRVCAGARCAWAPVWDVGPWNTIDDYWNPAGSRQTWADLPQGKPEAQAAYEDGYNGGQDGFGRQVANPAGIDLGDGTFWDGLGLNDNSWVTVTFAWTGSGPMGRIATTGGSPLTVRATPKLAGKSVGLAGMSSRVRVQCKVSGDAVNGNLGSTSTWYQLDKGYFVSGAYVADVSGAPDC